MKKNISAVLAKLISILGTILAIYIGGYWLFIRPVYYLVTGYTAGILTLRSMIISIVQIFIASTVSGGIWCVFDIIATKVKNEPRD